MNTKLSALILVALCVSNSYAADLYVSPNGNDANPGLGPGPSQALRTIQAAVDKLQPGDTCLVRGGTYRETVVFPRSGQAGRPIAIKPFQDEKPVITGCDPVTGWTRHQGKIWKAPMPWTLGLGRNQVFAAGAVMIEARHPNDPAPGLEMYVSDLSPLWPTFGEFSISDPAEHPDRLVSELLQGQPADHWKGAVYYGVHYQGWCGQTGVIESSRSGEITVADRTRGWWFPLRSSSGHYANEEGRGMIVGHINALDRPGEWHWQDNTLYFIPQDDIEPGAVEAKSRQLAFDLSGRSQIQITGIAITAASARLDGSSHCTLEGCDFSYISHYVRHYGIGQIEHGRDTVKSGETGIFIGGHDNSFLNCSLRFSAGTGFHVRGYHHTIHNCLIDEVSYTSHYLNAITDAVSDYNDYENFLVGGHTITYNTMRNAGRHFFNFYGNGTSLASRDRRPMDYMATLFAHNHLYNGMLQTRDAGFLSGYHSSGGTLNDLNSNVCYNVLHDCYDISAMRWNVLGMIYLDLGTCDVDVHHNLLWASPGSHQHGIWFNTCCVDIHEHDNVLHREFIHNSAGLKPRDFPQGKPFAFGHDFEYPPALPKWPQLDRRRLQAEACSSHSAGVGKSSTGISGLNDGDWFAFDRIDLGAGWQSAVLRLACGAKEANTNRSARAAPRHQKATDTLVLESTRNDGTAEGVRNQWTFLHSLEEGAWVRFNQVPLGDGYRRFRIIYGNDSHTPGRIEVRLDSFDGPLVGEAALPKTDRHRGGHVQIYAETIAQLSADAAGTRDVFLVFRSDGGEPRVGFEYLGFEQYRGAIPLQKNEIKLELRAGGKDGRKIGEFYPRFTGGEDAYREFVAKLEPAQDAGPLFLVVRSALAQPLGAVDWLSLEKSAQSVDTNGLGAPPRTDEQGGLVFPQPTNRPRSRPNDHYVSQRAAESSASRPFFTATRLATPAVVDGKLNEWRDAPKSMPLSQSIKGAASSELSSTAWIGYDDEAFYVAAEHPDKDPATLRESTHLWGQTQGMEIAFQADGPAAGPLLNLRGFTDGYFESAETEGTPPALLEQLTRAVSYRTNVGPDGWSCEWRIPFAACGFTPHTAPVFRFNLAVRKSEDAWLFWRGTGAGASQLLLAGRLVFPDELSSASADVPREGLVVWLDAADSESLARDDEGRVSAWKDKSGQGNHAIQEKVEHQPRYTAEGLGGKPALEFHEKRATRLELPDLSDEKISATVFVVFSNPTPGAKNNANPRLFTASNGKEYDYLVGICALVPGMETGGPRQTVATVQDRWARKTRVGCFSPNYQTFFTGQIAEILVYTRLLTPEERDYVRIRLSTKWGL